MMFVSLKHQGAQAGLNGIAKWRASSEGIRALGRKMVQDFTGYPMEVIGGWNGPPMRFSAEEITKDRGMASRGRGRIAEELSAAIGTLPGRAIAPALGAADGDSTAIQGIFQLRNEDGHTAQEKGDFGGSAPRTMRRFPGSSHFHRGIDADVICFVR